MVEDRLLVRRVQVQASHSPCGNQALRFPHTLRAPVWINARKRNRDIGIPFSELHDFIVRDARPSRKPLVHRKNYKSNLSRAVILAERVRVPRGTAVTEVLFYRSVGTRALISG